jgi:hypothetical protein
MHPSRSSPPLRTVARLVVATVVATMWATFAAIRPAVAAPPEFDSGSGLPVVGNFAPVTLNGIEQLTSATIAPFVVTDDSGLLAGWHVTLLVPDFRNGSGACSVGATASIAGGNVSMNAPVITAGDAFTDMTGVVAANTLVGAYCAQATIAITSGP